MAGLSGHRSQGEIGLAVIVGSAGKHRTVFVFSLVLPLLILPSHLCDEQSDQKKTGS